ncbi:hypothetical protein SUGI_0212190 [Cryptomeria japonica]|nr:hypothetical protein SUGI_0212190 [Cryptomeria japonica]
MATVIAQVHIFGAVVPSANAMGSAWKGVWNNAFFGLQKGAFNDNFITLRSKQLQWRWAIGPVRVINKVMVGIDLRTKYSEVAIVIKGKPTIVTNANMLVGQIAKL